MGNGLDIGKPAQPPAKSVVEKAKQSVSEFGERAEDATHAVGNRLQSWAGTMRDKAPQEGVMGTAACSLAEGLEAGGHYLQDKGLKGMADDVTNIIRRNPVPALFAGVGLGFLLARLTVRR